MTDEIKPIPLQVRLICGAYSLVSLAFYGFALYLVMMHRNYLCLIIAILSLRTAVSFQPINDGIQDHLKYFKKHGWPEGGESLIDFLKREVFSKS